MSKFVRSVAVAAALAFSALVIVGCGDSGGDGHKHTWGEWKVITNATCDAPGERIRVCTEDESHTETQVIPQLSGAVCESGGGDDVGRTVEIGGLTWMSENLNINTANSWCYNDDASNCAKYGRLYTWDAAMSACPPGWRLPTRQDWDDLVAAVGGNTGAGTKLKSKSPDWDGSDDFGFSALPGGYRSPGGSFGYAGNYGVWWSAMEVGSGQARYRDMYTGHDYVSESAYGKDSGLSVRCVK